MTSLPGRLEEDLRAALRAGDVRRREVLRLLRDALRSEELAKGRPLDEGEVFVVLQGQVRQRQESIEQFRRGNRPDLVAQEEEELAILREYLPPPLEREEVVRLARQVIQEVGARGPADKGRVMGRLMPPVKGRAEGSLVSEVVSQLLESLGREGPP